MLRVIDDGNPDGQVLGAGPGSKVGFYGAPPIPQRSNPMQATIQAFGAGQLLTAVVMPTPIGGCVSMNTQEALLSITPTFANSAAGNFCTSTDFVLAFNKQQSIASAASVIGIGGVRATNNGIIANLVHGTNIAGNATAQGDPCAFVLSQGIPVIAVTLTGLGVVSASTSEQIFTITGISAAGTAVINTAGQVVGIQITAHGQGYSYPPAIVFGGGGPVGGVITPQSGNLIGGTPFSPSFQATGAGNVAGTYTGMDYPAATAAAPYGSGATAQAITDSTGRVIACVITNPGSGYQIAPSVSFAGGNTFAPGMIAHVNKQNPVSGIAIGGVRVVGPYQIAIQFMNVSTASISPIPADTYKFVVNNDFAAVSNLLQYRFKSITPVAASGASGAATSTSIEFAATIVGVLATDFGLPASNGSFPVTNITYGQTRCIDGGMGIQIVGAGCATILVTDWLSVPVLKQQPVAPSTLLYPYLSPTTGITPQSFAELTFAVTGVPANSVIHVNKPTATNGVGVVNARVSAANTIYIGYQNVLAVPVTLPAEFYTIEVFNQPIGAVCVGSNMQVANNALYHIQQISPTFNAALDLLNEIRDAKAAIGVLKGY